MTPEINLALELSFPPEQVWELLAQLERHGEWMADVAELHKEGDEPNGVGTRLRALTKVWFLHTEDVIEVTQWIPGKRIRVVHQGLVKGEGEFHLRSVGTGTVFGWWERLRFPWYLGGPILGWLAVPILKRIWRGNLDRFKALLEAVK